MYKWFYNTHKDQDQLFYDKDFFEQQTFAEPPTSA